jgi:hypothetical protein
MILYKDYQNISYKVYHINNVPSKQDFKWLNDVAYSNFYL